MKLGPKPTIGFSQVGEDLKLWDFIESLPGDIPEFCIEFGAGNGVALSNTKIFRDLGWGSLLLDANPRGCAEVVMALITAENINQLFKANRVPEDVGIMSIDLDGNDYWIWKAIKLNPAFVIVEYNPIWGGETRKAIKYNPEHAWDKTVYYGASRQAFRRLARERGYVGILDTNLNLIFARKDLGIPERLRGPAPPPRADHAPDTLNRPWVDV